MNFYLNYFVCCIPLCVLAIKFFFLKCAIPSLKIFKSGVASYFSGCIFVLCKTGSSNVCVTDWPKGGRVCQKDSAAPRIEQREDLKINKKSAAKDEN